jgi:hypothetical protein
VSSGGAKWRLVVEIRAAVHARLEAIQIVAYGAQVVTGNEIIPAPIVGIKARDSVIDALFGICT